MCTPFIFHYNLLPPPPPAPPPSRFAFFFFRYSYILIQAWIRDKLLHGSVNFMLYSYTVSFHKGIGTHREVLFLHCQPLTCVRASFLFFLNCEFEPYSGDSGHLTMWMIVSDCVNGEDAVREASEASAACTSKSLYTCIENILSFCRLFSLFSIHPRVYLKFKKYLRVAYKENKIWIYRWKILCGVVGGILLT